MARPFLLFLLFAISTTAFETSLVVKTKSGPIRGKLVRLATARQAVYEFTRVPFAEPPVGELRFKMPLSVTVWNETLNATKPANSCIQVSSFGNSNYSTEDDTIVPGTLESEDCLYLNIWVPAATLDPMTSRRTATKLPVYVFIHGGGFANGRSMMKLFNGTVMAAYDNIIFVSIQYRLGLFGFGYFQNISSNMGLWDQVEALKWVSENIALFGGNKEKITIGGENSGAASVTFHLLSPYSWKYFQKAVIQSGSALAPWAFYTQQVAKMVTDIAIDKTTTCSNDMNADSRFRCLQLLDANTLAKASFGLSWAPVIDGDFVPRDPREMLSSGDFYKVPLLIGTNKDEGSIHFAMSPDAMKLLPSQRNPDASLIDKLNSSHYATLLKIGLNNEKETAFFNAVYRQYLPLINKRTNRLNGADILNSVIQATGDYLVTCPTYNFAKMTSQFLEIFVYHFTQKPTQSLMMPPWMGTFQGQELGLVFGDAFSADANDYGYSYDDKLFSKVLMEYWGNFIKFGNPNVRDQFFGNCDDDSSTSPLAIDPTGCSLLTWPPYNGNICPSQITELNIFIQVFNDSEAVSCNLKNRDCLFWEDPLAMNRANGTGHCGQMFWLILLVLKTSFLTKLISFS